MAGNQSENLSCVSRDGCAWPALCKESGYCMRPIDSRGVDSDTHRAGATPTQSERLMAPASQAMTSTPEGMTPARVPPAQPSPCNSGRESLSSKLSPLLLDQLINYGERSHYFAQAETEAILTCLRELRTMRANETSALRIEHSCPSCGASLLTEGSPQETAECPHGVQRGTCTICIPLKPSAKEPPGSHQPHLYATHGPCHVCGGQPSDPIHAMNGFALPNTTGEER